MASLAESGQQTPIVVVAAERQPGRYVVIDGYKRIAAFDDSLASASVERATRLRNSLW
jgi:quinol monooxygenase YgiN